MPSAFSWPMSVPSALRAPAPVNWALGSFASHMKREQIKNRDTKSPSTEYYARLLRASRSYRVNLARKGWCCYDHEHFDWEGLGDRSWRDRRRHLSALLRAFRAAQKELRGYPLDYQLFITVAPNKSASDAIFIHTPNPNNTPFPMEPEGELTTNLPHLIANKIDSSRYAIYKKGVGKEIMYTIIPNSTCTQKE